MTGEETNKLESQLEHWINVNYRMDEEGFEYCFKHYSSFSEIRDEEFHKLRLSLLSDMNKMRQLVQNRISDIESQLDSN